MSCCGAFAFILRLQPALAWLALPPPPPPSCPPPPPPPPPCHLHHNIDSTWPPVPASTMSTARSPTARNTFRCTRDPAREKYGTASFTEKYSKDSRTATTSPRSAARRGLFSAKIGTFLLLKAAQVHLVSDSLTIVTNSDVTNSPY